MERKLTEQQRCGPGNEPLHCSASWLRHSAPGGKLCDKNGFSTMLHAATQHGTFRSTAASSLSREMKKQLLQVPQHYNSQAQPIAVRKRLLNLHANNAGFSLNIRIKAVCTISV